MDLMTISMDGNKYISVDDIIKNAPIYSKGCRSSRDLIRKKELDNYIYVKMTDDGWIKTDGKSAKFDKVFIEENIIKSIPELNKESEKIIDENGIEMAPEIIELEDNEKFKDENGLPLNIETRGERKYDKIFFKVKDVSRLFDITNLKIVILAKDKNYDMNTHYKYFMCNGTNSLKKTSKKTLFLTYEGILRVLFVTRNNKTAPFIKWALEVLFITQMGTNEDKQKLAGDILGINAQVVKEVFNCDANTVPCVYLFNLGYVKDLRLSMNIDNKYDDNSIVAKFGFTKSLARRTTEHINNYSKINGCNLKLKHYSYVDPQYINVAEKDIKEFVSNFDIKLKYNNEEELIVIPNKFIKLFAEKYEHIGKKYSGHISELITKIKELENHVEKQNLEHKLEIQILKSELQKEKYDHELLKKDYEILKLKTNHSFI
jgi:hypothetical protein